VAKVKKNFLCSNCGAQSPKWIGNCPSCNEWNTYLEETITVGNKREEQRKAMRTEPNYGSSKIIPLQDIVGSKLPRIKIHDGELNRVLGGGIVRGSLVLIGGQPGIGKSTLMLQLGVKTKLRVLYVSGEESEEQIKMRADRIGILNKNCFILTEVNLNKIISAAKTHQPDVIIIDSIQTLSSSIVESIPGSISQVRECTVELQRFAKEYNIPTFIIGHINKDGAIAGPKLLEHIVDTVLQFEGDANYSYRILRTTKNRFGSTDELGIYEMRANGLREISNPSEMLLSQNEDSLSGSAIAATVEGLRPMLIEVQALVSSAVYGTPQRSSTGFDLRRLSMLLAVLEKRCGLYFGQNDVFLNIAGGLKISDPSIDLSIVAALTSSLENISIDNKICFAAEVGLSGEIRAVNRIDQRIQEADRLGFTQIFISKYNLKGLDLKKYNIEVSPISKIDQLFSELFG